MARNGIPLVSNGRLLLPDAAEDRQSHILVGSDAWYTWLTDKKNRSFSFRAPVGTITVRRERQRNGWYWYAYCKRQGKLRKAYLGRTEELTLERLNAVTARLHSTEPAHTVKHNLPPQLTPLIGREQEVAAACTLLRRPQVRLLTLTGTGGIGKTRLAIEIATALLDDFIDGVYFVALAAITDPDLIMATIAQTLGLRESGEWGYAQPQLLQQLQASLSEKHLLLLVDNFEQVASAAPRLAELVAACPNLKMLVTSRAVLHIRGEHECAVAPLALPDPKRPVDCENVSQYAAVALFVQRAQAIKPDFQITQANAPLIAEICVRLDGLPLAIELAAARVKVLPPQALLARLGHRLQILKIDSPDVLPRQQTLCNTLTWSYDLLNTQEQRLFRRLCVFVGGCTLEAAETICNDLGVSVLDGVSSLIDKSLLSQTEQTDHEPRLVMLETIREYGLECLNTSGEDVIAQRAHAAYYLALAEQAAPELHGLQQAAWLERLEREHDNLRAALGWFLKPDGAGSSREMALRLGGALWKFWSARGLSSEGRTFLERALEGSEGVAASVRAKALSVAADFASVQSDDDLAEALSQESLDLYREVGDTRGIASSLSLLASVVRRKKGNFAAARSLIEESLTLYREVGDKDAIAWSLWQLANNASMQGEYIRGRTLFEESLALYRELGNKWGIATALKQSALWLFVAQGDQGIMQAWLEESLALFREVGDKDGMAFYYWLSGWVALSQGDRAIAHALVEQSLALWREIGNRWFTALSLGMLGKVVAHRGDLVAARAFHEESLAIARALDDKWLTAFCLEELAAVVTAQGEAVWGARLWGAAETLRDMVGSPRPPVFRADYERSVAAARTQLGEKAFTAAWAEGRTMTPQQVFIARGPARIATSTPPVQSPTTYPNGLTAREVEVLRLVVQGMTNRQVADQLVISPRYVNWLLTSIYSKLDVSSRSAATRCAIEQHLL